MKIPSLFVYAATVVFLLVGCKTKVEDEEIVYVIMFKQITMTDGTPLEFAVVYPEKMSLNQERPVLITFPPGNQDKGMVEWGLYTYWIDWTKQRDWIVISPAAPLGVSFYEGASVYVPELMDWIRNEYQVEGDRFHLAGVSAGGYSGFRIAIDYPENFFSLTVLPGLPPEEEDFDKLDRLLDIKVNMYVGQNDFDWVQPMAVTAQKLTDLGVDVTFLIIPYEGHVISSITAALLFDLFEMLRPQNAEP
jgi:predicted peptidase